MLSDEECRDIWQTSMSRCHPMNDISVAGILTAKAAYALGAERSRVVKPLGWDSAGTLSVSYPVDYKIRALPNGYRVIHETSSDRGRYGFAESYVLLDEAKAACQKHHESFVLSQLEPV